MSYNSPEAASTPIMTRSDVALHLVEIAEAFLRRNRRVRMPYVSARASQRGSVYATILASDMLDKTGKAVGGVRVIVEVPMSEGRDILCTVDWTREIFQFWYRSSYRIPNSPDPSSEFLKKMEDAYRGIRNTAEGVVTVRSMNLHYRKVKKSKLRDDAMRRGRILG